MEVLVFIYRVVRKGASLIRGLVESLQLKLVLAANRVVLGGGCKFNGLPVLSIHRQGNLLIGSDFRCNNGLHHNRIGRQQRSFFIVEKNASLTIGNNVAISATAMIALVSITIEDNVRIGGNTVIYDSDFHSLDVAKRIAQPEDTSDRKCKPVHICNGVFVGSHCTILKDVTIGENAIIGAGSVVSKNVPANEVWAGNPAKCVKKLATYNLERA